MIYKLALTLIILITIFAVSYDYVSKIVGGLKEMEVVNISDEDIAEANNEINDKGEIVISDSDFGDEQIKVATSSKSREDNLKKNKDGSESTVMYDGYGNKTEIKKFKDHSRVRMIMIQTFAQGEKRVFVYGHNGKVKNMPVNTIDSLLTDSPDEVANKAGIYETREDRQRRKVEIAQRKKDRLRKSRMEKFEIEKNSIPEPVYREIQQDNEDSEKETSDY